MSSRRPGTPRSSPWNRDNWLEQLLSSSQETLARARAANKQPDNASLRDGGSASGPPSPQR